MIVKSTQKPKYPPEARHLKTTTTATTLAAGRIGWSWSNILDSADLHARAGESTESGLGTWAWGLGSVTWMKSICDNIRAEGYDHTSSGADLDVEGVDAELLAADGHILGSQHSGVWGGLITIGLDLHATSDTGDGFAATGITQKLAFDHSTRHFMKFPSLWTSLWNYGPEIGDVDEGIIERREDTSNAEDELAWATVSCDLSQDRELTYPL